MTRSLRWGSLVLLAVSFSSILIMPINSLDFWWHLKTGEYILEFNKLPDQDPLTYGYAAMPDDPAYAGRVPFLLKQYWLAQIIYAKLVDAFGLYGIIFFRALFYVIIAMVALLLLRVCFAGKTSLIPLVFFALATSVALEDSDRPQMFAFLFAFLVVYIIELAVCKKDKRLYYLNIPVMLISSNLHGGYIIGIGYLLVYMASANFEDRLKEGKWPLLISSTLAILVTYFNPGHWQAFRFIIMPANYLSMEYRSPLAVLPHVLSSPGWLAYWAVLGLSLPASLYHFAKRRFSWGMLLLGTAIASLYAMRYVYFFLPLGAVFITGFLHEVIFRRVRLMAIVDLAAIVLFSILIFSRPMHQNSLGIRSLLWDSIYPVSAAEFMSREALPQPVLNNRDYGGYLEWRLWPKYRMFIDTRHLIDQIDGQYREMMGYTDKGRGYLNSYGIATVITPAINPYSGEIIPLVRGMYNDPGWALAYNDGRSLIFTRKNQFSREIGKNNIYYQVLQELDVWQPLFPWVPGYAKSRAEALTHLGLR